MKKRELYYVYILKCKDGTLYCGQTNNLEKRVEEHNAGKGAKYTSGRRPVKVVYVEKALSRSDALKREVYIKKLSRDSKIQLVELNSLSHEKKSKKNSY